MQPPNKLVAFAHRPPTEAELTRFQLVLSTFQDGTGMLAVNDGSTLPGWRDFERATALVFGGIPSENKDVMDVRLPDPRHDGVFFGISCKMRRELNRVKRNGRVTIELSNAARAFWDRLGDDGITTENYRDYSDEVGISLIDLVSEWHSDVSVAYGGDVDLQRSYHLALMWNSIGEYQLYQFPISLPDPDSIAWDCPLVRRRGGLQVGNSIRGYDDTGTIFEWYGQSGGQLKYYPRASDALWQSDIFRLEPLPPKTPHGLLSKAESYYPNLWPK